MLTPALPSGKLSSHTVTTEQQYTKMRTKTLLLTAAALLAAGIVSTQAQPVYSQNIVGYTTEILPVGWASVNTPLDLSGGNYLTNVFPNPGPGGGNNPLDFSKVYVWNGVG